MSISSTCTAEAELSLPEDFHEWTDTALVLKVGKFRETDLWLRLLTREHGLVSAFAFGGSKSRKRFCGCLDLLNELQVRTKATKNGAYLALQEGVLLQGPQKLRSNWSRLGMFMNCVQFTEALGVVPENSKTVFHLLKDVLALAEELNSEHSLDLFPFLYRLRLVSDQGYAPNFQHCQRCGQQVSAKSERAQGMFPASQTSQVRTQANQAVADAQVRVADPQVRVAGAQARGQGTTQQLAPSATHRVGAYFMVSEGFILCPHCAQSGGLKLSGRALEVLNFCQENPPKLWELPLSWTEKQECIRAIDSFVRFHLGLAWESGGFRRV